MIGHPTEHLSWLYRGLLRLQTAEGRRSIDDRREQERIVQRSGLDWTLVRPPRLTEGRPTGSVRAGEDLWIGMRARVDRADLAGWLLDCLDDPGTVGRAPALLSGDGGAPKGTSEAPAQYGPS